MGDALPPGQEFVTDYEVVERVDDGRVCFLRGFDPTDKQRLVVVVDGAEQMYTNRTGRSLAVIYIDGEKITERREEGRLFFPDVINVAYKRGHVVFYRGLTPDIM